MKISPVALCFTKRPLRPIAKRLSSHKLYRFCHVNTTLSMRYNSHRKRFLRPIQLILSEYMGHERLSEICHKYLVQRKYLNYLEVTWKFMNPGQRPGVIFEGADHLRDALSKGAGVILVSGHNYGFSRMIGPILAEKGYPISRAGSLNLEIVRRRWGSDSPWEYIYLPKDPWGRVRALKQILTALKQNRIVHLLIINRPTGDTKAEVEFYGRNFFLDTSVFELITDLQAPILPCFALFNSDGDFTVKFHAPLGNTTEELVAGFSRLFSRYLKEFPEYVRFWKPLLNQKAFW
jgi:lauroyl/myristoyl acyltransferase